MSEVKITEAYTDLVEYNKDLLERYISRYIGVDSAPEDFKLDVKSYLILLHAALEDYIEGICVFVSEAACEIYKKNGVITLPLAFLFGRSKNLKDRVSDKTVSNDKSDSPRDFLLDSLGDLQAIAVSDAISNNGINTRYLNSLLQHYGIHFDSTDTRFDSWKKLADFRGDYAHAVEFYHGKKPVVIKVLAPEKAKAIGDDCLLFCDSIKNEAIQAITVVYPPTAETPTAETPT
ncbi:hypothetical protein ACS428_23665, partial [Salmonella enterica]|uniref:hypothetical protein n=1 Tax=Salmonella enterica TaxID=28901 RepID=UPI003F442EEB